MRVWAVVVVVMWFINMRNGADTVFIFAMYSIISRPPIAECLISTKVGCTQDALTGLCYSCVHKAALSTMSREP